jgi:hypothetical protein
LLKYARKQRASIYHPATIDDLPFEVLREAFLYLKLEDLVSPSRVNRSWRPAAQNLQRSRLVVENEVYSLMCGIQLTRIVFGYEAYSIKHLELYLRLIDPEHIPILSRLLSPTLHTLDLDFEEVEESEVCYAILDQIFSQCQGIRNLKLQYFYLKDDPASITQTIKTGFYQLSQLSMSFCQGDLGMFVVSVPISNLISFSNSFFGSRVDESDIFQAVAINYPTIKILSLKERYNSSATLLKFVECCREIEELSLSDYSGGLALDRDEFEAIVSLPRLKSLNIDCRISDDGVSVISQCKGLKHLALGRGSIDLTNILFAVGVNLVSLDYNSSTSILETVDAFIEHCPNLQMLETWWDDAETNGGNEGCGCGYAQGKVEDVVEIEG